MSDIQDASVSEEINEKAIATAIRELIKELSPNESIDAVEPSMSLVEDLSYHSLALMELAFTIEDEFGLSPMNESVALKIKTVSDVEAHVIQELKAKHAAA